MLLAFDNCDSCDWACLCAKGVSPSSCVRCCSPIMREAFLRLWDEACIDLRAFASQAPEAYRRSVVTAQGGHPCSAGGKQLACGQLYRALTTSVVARLCEFAEMKHFLDLLRDTYTRLTIGPETPEKAEAFLRELGKAFDDCDGCVCADASAVHRLYMREVFSSLKAEARIDDLLKEARKDPRLLQLQSVGGLDKCIRSSCCPAMDNQGPEDCDQCVTVDADEVSADAREIASIVNEKMTPEQYKQLCVQFPDVLTGNEAMDITHEARLIETLEAARRMIA